MEIIGIVTIVSLALLFVGRSWRQTFKNTDRPDCTHDGCCQGCYGCNGAAKPITKKTTIINK